MKRNSGGWLFSHDNSNCGQALTLLFRLAALRSMDHKSLLKPNNEIKYSKGTWNRKFRGNKWEICQCCILNETTKGNKLVTRRNTNRKTSF